MGQAGKGLDHTNPSSPGSRKPALGTGGHYPPYSAGPRDPGGLEAGRSGSASLPAAVGSPPGPEAGPGRWAEGCCVCTLSVSKLRAPTCPCQHGEKARGRQPAAWTGCTAAHPASRPHCPVPAVAWRCGSRWSPRPLTFCASPPSPFPISPPGGGGVPPRAAGRSAGAGGSRSRGRPFEELSAWPPRPLLRV